MTRAVFLDRDGTLITLVHHLADPADVAVMAGVADAIVSLKKAGFSPVIVTNQSVIGRGKLSEDGLADVHSEMNRQLGEAARIDAIYHCPLKPAQKDPRIVEDPMRKPGPGMLIAAANDHQLDLVNSWMIGDTISDMLAGRAAGCRTILVQTGYGGQVDVDDPAIDVVAADLSHAAQMILNGETRP